MNTEFKDFISIMLTLTVGIAAGITIGISASTPHTEKHGCEYVEKAECKQVWIKK